MKKVLVSASAALFLLCACSNNDPKVAGASSNSTAKDNNLAASHVITKAFETGDVSGVDSVVAENFVDHTDHGDVVGRDSLKAMIKMMHNDYKDMKMETVREMADDEQVWQMVRYTGNGDGKMMPAGPYDMHAIEVINFKDGKITEHWGYGEMREMMKMMMQMQGMNKQPMMDSTKGK